MDVDVRMVFANQKMVLLAVLLRISSFPPPLLKIQPVCLKHSKSTILIFFQSSNKKKNPA